MVEITGTRAPRIGWRRRITAAVAAATVLAPLPFVLRSQLANAAGVTGVIFAGGAGTTVVGSTLYARQGATLSVRLTTTNDTKCVELAGITPTSTAVLTSATTKSDWPIPVVVPSGNGTVNVTASASPSFNVNGKCTGQTTSNTGSFVLDNAGPTVTGTASPTPNAAGWNRTDVTVTWSATDAGSGVATGPTPSTASVTADTAGSALVALATDRLGNPGVGNLTVKLDKTAPGITGSRTPAANANGWNNTDVAVSFSCSDTPSGTASGIASCLGGTTLTAGGAGQSVTGTATDIAGNTASSTVGGINIDRVAPSLAGAPLTAPNAAGWYTGDVTIRWTATDALSGIVSPPADSTIGAEGSNLTVATSVTDRAGNTTSATSPAVRIDRTAPSTSATAPAAWNNTDVTVVLAATDSLSGVAATRYRVDGGATQTGTSVTFASEGVRTLEFWSVDAAGNTEEVRSVEVKIDKTPPTITHTQAPAANPRGWNNTPVTVTFTCGDGLSGVAPASCTAPQTVTGEGQAQLVTGTAVDNAGNTATDPATVSIDLTAPSITGAPDRAPNGNGWYAGPVTVSFTCDDALSGVFACAAAVELAAEGDDLQASGTARDAADNEATATVRPIRIDTTKPTLTAAAPSGWTNADQTITWSCADALSGIDGACPAPTTVTGEGDDLSASASVSDRAGNQTVTTVTGIRIDRTAPVTHIVLPDPVANGWHAGPVQVGLEALDALSGVAATYYAVDSGAPVLHNGPFTLGLRGKHTITFWSVDVAGNTEAAGTPVDVWIDDVAPSIEGSRQPAANAYGWNNTTVTVSFACADDESGLAECTSPVDLANEGADQSVTGMAVDQAGNSAEATVDGIAIDRTAPTVLGAATTSPNAFGWYRGDVTVRWTPDDALSGIDPLTVPADSTVTGEGTDLGAGPVSVADRAGNTATASVNGLKVDRTAPTVSGRTVNADGTDRSPNAAGWFSSAVRVRFSCADALSGVQECAGDVVLADDGADQSASGQATDRADNGAGTTVTGIAIDSKAPATAADVTCDAGGNGFCRSSSVKVTLTAADQPGLSGVASIAHRVGSGAWSTTAGGTAQLTVPLTGSGTATIEYRATDVAGNTEASNTATVKYDTIAPTVTHTVSPAANGAGWSKADTTVHFDAIDDVGGSTVDPATVTPDTTVTGETSGVTIAGQAADLAGNVGTDSVVVRLDKTAPTVTASVRTAPAKVNGWYPGPVTVGFACTDDRSGMATCPADVVLSANGAGQTATGTGTDVAGNSADATLTGIDIDAGKPAVVQVNVAGQTYTLGAVPAPTCTATDAVSGVASCTVTVTGGLANGVGTFSFTATAVDVAGNTSSQTGTFKVVYRFDGFLQPINDTAHQVDQATSIFKGGSTVPAKLQLKRADGTIVAATTAPTWLAPVKGSATTAAVDESVYAESATSGSTYRWDATAQQYLYNWSTKGASTGFYHRIGVRLDDGQTYYVNIGLR